MLIPIYNIYLIFKINIDLAHEFGMSTGFGVGLTLLFPIFACILAFGKAIYRDGSQETSGDDPISETINSAAAFVSNAVAGAGKPRRDPDALKKLEQLKNLKDSGVLSEEEYEKMKADLMERI